LFDTVNTFMDINELESFKLSDAVKFNKTLNPRLWGRDEHLLPEVHKKLMAIADDFREFLGVDGLNVKDITVSGSNAAYTYTPHSDVDLHLVVEFPQGQDNEIYRELFDAKKYQYNDQHNYKIGGYDVELYVQDADQVHHSQGIYSVLNNDWVSVPRRRRPEVDDISVRSKFEDIGHRIEQAVASGDPAQLEAIAAKVKHMRQAGLDTTGEFGPENLAFKALRTQGLLDQLSTARSAVKDQELSLAERKKKKRGQRSYGSYFYPGYTFSGDSAEGGGDGGGGESVMENKDIKQVLQPFIDSCVKYLGIEKAPKIVLKRDPEWTRRNGTFGRFDSDTYSVTLAVTGRHTLDILRTLAHELTHACQDEQAEMPVDAGETGSTYEDEANAMAGRIMRHWVDQYPEFFKDVPLEESVKDKLAAVAAAACVAGTSGCATTGADAIRTVQDVGRTAQTMKGYSAADARAEVLQKVKDELRRRQGQVVPEAVMESLDQPYKILRWEKGDYGDVDAIARLDDGTFLSIMFNKGFSQDTKEEAWSVEFYRNNSQEKTGEGDQQRVFATVLSAVQTFVSDRVPGAKGKYKPNKIYFSASKEVNPDEDQRKAMTRARLYDSLVQRYARALGFRAFRADTGNKVMYELSRIKQPVAEASGYIPINDKEARDPRYSMAITQDIKPGEVQRQARKMGWTTDAAGKPPLLKSNASNLRESQDSNMKIAHILKEATLGGFPVKVLNIQDQGVDEAGNANSGRRGANFYSPPDSSPVKPGRAEKTATGVRHHADPSRYGGYDPKPEDDRLLGAQSRWRLDRAVRGLNEFAPGNSGGDSGRWYTDDELADTIGDDWFEDFDVSNDGFNIDAYGEKAKQNLVGYANSWFNDKGYNVNVMGVDHNDVDHDLKWYIVGSFQNNNFADKDVDEARNNYHANRTGFRSGSRDPEGQDPQARQQVWGLKINGNVWSKQGKDVTFTSKQAAINTMNAILKNRPDLQGKIGLVTRGGVAEGSVAKKPQPYNEPGWAKNLPQEKLDAIAGPRYKKDKKDKKVSEGEGNFAGDTPVNIGGATVKRMAIGDTVTYFGRRAKIVNMTTDRKMSRITIANDMGGITKDVLTSDLKRTGVAEAIKLNAPQKSWSKQDMQDYLTRIKTGTKTKQDRFKPIIHGSNVKAITKDDGTEEWDLEDLKRQITTPPRAILGSNAKMSKSKKEGAITYDLTLPALSGIVVDEETGEFVEITTCPGAGECQLFCYARKGGYVMFPAASMSAAQALNFLVNHPDEYMAMFDTEIKKTKALADKNGIKLLVRIHDAGDFFSKEYWDLSKRVQLNNPDVRFYFYSKMGDPVTDPNTPANTLPNFSDGGAKSREVKKVELYRNAGKNLKGAPTIPKDMFRDLFVTDAKGKYVKDEQGRTQVKSPEAWENFKQKLSTKYNIDPGSIITYDQMNRIPEGPKPKWNVVVFPAGHGDLGATRLDVQNQFLMFH